MTSRIKERDRVYQLDRYHRRRKFIIEHLGGKCFKCGSTEDLQIDHVENLPDKIPLSKLWGTALDRLVDELTRCQLLCRTHHDDKSVQEKGHNRGVTHGTYNTYRRYKCRCMDCVEAYRKVSP